MPFSSAAFCKSHLKEGRSSMNAKLDWIFKHQPTSVSPCDPSDSWSSSWLLSCWEAFRGGEVYNPTYLHDGGNTLKFYVDDHSFPAFRRFLEKKVSQKFCKMFYPGLESTRSVRSLNKILQKKIYENQTKF